MKPVSIHALVGDTDIYLLDQIMKNRYQKTDLILDAGCGMGRNLHWLLYNKIRVNGVDNNADFINELKAAHPLLPPGTFQLSTLENMPFNSDYFDHIICSAVLHFANGNDHFHSMMAELVRVLKISGTLFIRMASNIGIEKKVALIEDGVYHIPDSSVRFLLTRQLLQSTIERYNLSFVEPLKTVNVDDVRCMSTLLLQKT